MFSTAIEQVTKSIFPIFFELRQQGLTTIGVSGTGFFINDEGHFMTAHHVISAIPENAKILYAGNVPHSIIPPVEIEEIYSDAVKDIYIGKVALDKALPKLVIADNEPKIGQSLSLCGYPLAQISQNLDGSINVNNVRKYWQPTFMVDGFQGTINGKTYTGFMTQHASLKGMSGGPIFGSDGIVYGMDVAVIGREIPDPATPITVHNGIGVGVSHIRDGIERANNT